MIKAIPFQVGFCLFGFVATIMNIWPRDVFIGVDRIVTERGVPFLMFRETVTGNFELEVFWSGVAGDVIISLVCSMIAGFVADFIFRTRRPAAN